MAQSRGLIRRLAGAPTALLLGGGVTFVAATAVLAVSAVSVCAVPVSEVSAWVAPVALVAFISSRWTSASVFSRNAAFSSST